MEPRPEPPSAHVALRREVERPGAGGHGLLPVLVLGAAMMSTLVAAALAMTMTPRARHCPRSGQRAVPVAASFARPAAPAVRPAPRAVLDVIVPPRIDPACAPRVYHGQGDVQEWTFETCASAPMPRRFVLSAP